ncbi:MAG: ion transporter [Chloracidobacterium sp.]|nr:ion transporter [Chloracidobacterium sp.]
MRLTAIFQVHRRRYFHEPWRVFGFCIRRIALMPASGAFSVLRSLRVLRVLRLIPRWCPR